MTKLSLPGPKIIGTREEPSDDGEVRALRVLFARANAAWHEIPAERLVSRGPRGRWLVDSESDLIFAVRRGAVFAPGRATPDFIQPAAPISFYVDRDGELVLLERLHGGRTWSEIYERTVA